MSGHWNFNGYQLCPLLAALLLYSYESDFSDNVIRSGHRKLARSCNLCFQYISDLIVFNNQKFLEYVKDIYPSQLNVEKTNQSDTVSDNLASYFDLKSTIKIDGKLSTKLYEKCDDFDSQIVNFSFPLSNIPSNFMVLTSFESLYMQEAAHTMMISNIAIKCQMKGLCFGDIDMNV